VKFKEAVKKTRHLENAWMPGLLALRRRDRPHVAPSDPRKLKGSADVDAALRHQQPNAHRWDFAIGFRHTNRQQDCVYWVEIHTANEKEVKVVLDKLLWLKDWLAGDGKLLNQFEKDFIWVSSGETSFIPGSPKLRRLAELGLRHKGSVLRIPALRPV
jgi:hypothetical protein